jgi:hypothetical protein
LPLRGAGGHGEELAALDASTVASPEATAEQLRRQHVDALTPTTSRERAATARP